MSSDNNRKSVNIRVDGDVWDTIDDNRSEICRQALRAAAEMKRGHGNIQRHAHEYDELLEERKRMETEIRVTRQMAFDELEEWDYDEYILPDGMPDSAGTFEETIVYASQYAKTYLDADYTEDQASRQIRTDMDEEGRQLPRVVAEWIVQHVVDEI